MVIRAPGLRQRRPLTSARPPSALVTALVLPVGPPCKRTEVIIGADGRRGYPQNHDFRCGRSLSVIIYCVRLGCTRDVQTCGELANADDPYTATTAKQ